MFNCDISKWDVSKVLTMDSMFAEATSFKQELCGASWVRSRASKHDMFKGSGGSISRAVCKAPITQGTAHRPFAGRRSITERKLIGRTPISMSVNTPSITSVTANTCSKCGTFHQSGRVSCCAHGGAWFKKCGPVGNENVVYKWSEGVKACKSEFEYNQWNVVVCLLRVFSDYCCHFINEHQQKRQRR